MRTTCGLINKRLKYGNFVPTTDKERTKKMGWEEIRLTLTYEQARNVSQRPSVRI